MTTPRVVAVLTWIYVVAFGLPAIPVSVYLLQRGTLPTFLDLFPMYGGPWSTSVGDGVLVLLLTGFLVVTLVAAWSALLVWNGSKGGTVLGLVLLPIEAVFWLGFALPFPWLIGMARAALLASVWRSQDRA